jgi:hypothetical protein
MREAHDHARRLLYSMENPSPEEENPEVPEINVEVAEVMDTSDQEHCSSTSCQVGW